MQTALFAFLLPTLLLAGCLPPATSVPGSVDATLLFTPDDKRVLVHTPERTLLFDIASERVIWRQPGGGRGDIASSPSGTYFALALQPQVTASATVSVRRTNDGSQVFAATVEHPARYFVETIGRRVDASDDGSWLAVATHDDATDQYALALHPAGGGAPRSLSEVEHSVQSLSFEPGGPRLAVAWRGQVPRVAVYGRAGDAWKKITTFERASCPVWVRGGLGFVTVQGYALWDGSEARTFLRTPIDDGYSFERCNNWAFSAAGDYLAEWDDELLTAHDTRSGATLFEYPLPRDMPDGLCGRTFRGALFRMFHCSGVFIELDLLARREVRTQSFGSPGSYSKTLFSDGASYTSSYTARVTPAGAYVDMARTGRGHVLYRLDP